MAHGCQERGLHLRGLKRAQVGIAQRELGFLAFRDVDDRAGESHRESGRIVAGLGAGVDPDMMPVAVTHAELEVERRPVAHGEFAGRQDRVAILGMVDGRVGPVGGEIGLVRVTQDVAIATRKIGAPLDQVLVPYTRLDRLDHQFELLALVFNLQLRQPALRDVYDRTREANRLARTVQAGQPAAVDPQIGAIGAAQAILAVEIRLLAGEMRLAGRLDMRAIVGMHEFAACPRQPAFGRLVITQHFIVARRKIGGSLGPLDVPNARLG